MVIGKHPKGLIFVVSAPAGTGKSTLVEMLTQEFPDTIVESCSCTTRLPRKKGEVAHKHYTFLSLSEFEKKMEEGAFLEYARVFGDYYGTPKEEVFRLLNQGKHVILVIDTQGAMQIKARFPVISIFLSPPSLEELSRRLYRRRTESEEKMQERLLWAKQEMEFIYQYDYHIINDHLPDAYQVLRSIVIAEEYKIRMEECNGTQKHINK